MKRSKKAGTTNRPKNPEATDTDDEELFDPTYTSAEKPDSVPQAVWDEIVKEVDDYVTAWGKQVRKYIEEHPDAGETHKRRRNAKT